MKHIVFLLEEPSAKEMLEGLLPRLAPEVSYRDSLVRIVCRELESWYLADLKAVEVGLKISGLAKHQGSKKYRSPDYLHSPSKELKHLTNDKYQKVVGSRNIGPHLDLMNKRSTSFRVFIEGIRKMLENS